MKHPSWRSWPLVLLVGSCLALSGIPRVAGAQSEEQLIAILSASNDAAKQTEACRQLIFVGTPASVSALAGVLGVDPVGQAALNTLERLPFSEAADALRAALPKAPAPLQIGLIASLAARRDVASVPSLIPLLGASNPAVASAAARGLGAIGDPRAIAALEAAASGSEASARPELQRALLAGAEALLTAGQRADAARLFGVLFASASLELLRTAAWCGQVRADEARRGELLLAAFLGADATLQREALLLLRQLPDRRAIEAILARWDELSVLQRMAVLDAQVSLGPEGAATMRRALADADPGVRLTALQASAVVGGDADVAALIAIAAQGEARERDAARFSLASLKGPAVGAALLGEFERAPVPRKVEVLRALGERGDAETAAFLLLHSRHPDERVANAAYRSLLRLLDPATLTPLLERAFTATSEHERRTLLRVLTVLCEHAPDSGQASRKVLDALRRLPAVERSFWLGLLPALGTPAALDEAIAQAQSADPTVARGAVLALSRWKTAAPASALLDLARGGTEVGALALKGALSLSEREPSVSNRLLLLELIAGLAHTQEDRRLLLEQVRRVNLPGAARLAATYLAEPELAELAAAAVSEIAASLTESTRQTVVGLAPRVLQVAQAPDVVERMVGVQDQVAPRLSSAPAVSRLPDRDPFRKQRVADLFFAEGAAVGDFNRDGESDIVAGPFWFEGPEFTQRHAYREPRSFTPIEYSDAFLKFVDDLDGDGWVDILVVPFPGRECYWYANPQGGPGMWTAHLVHATVGNESPLWGDVDGDGRRELVFCTEGYLGFARPDPADPRKPWVFSPVSGFEQRFHRFTHGLGLGDLNGDQRVDIIESSGWWEQPATPRGDAPWIFHPHRFAELGAQMPAVDLDGDGLLDVITAWNAHQYGLLWWKQIRRPDATIDWERNVILAPAPDLQSSDLRVSQMHALEMADLNRDGRLDLVTGKRFWAHGPHGDKEPAAPAVLLWFEVDRAADGAVRFMPRLIDDNSGVGTQVTVADVNRDGRPDVVVANKKGIFLHVNER